MQTARTTKTTGTDAPGPHDENDGHGPPDGRLGQQRRHTRRLDGGDPRNRALRTKTRARAFARGNRASAGIELALGAVGLLAVAALCADLYTRVEADTASARMAVTMADYVSRGPDTDAGTLDGAALVALGAFLHEHEPGAAADLVFVVSAFRVHVGKSNELLWSDDTLRFGDAKVTAKLAASCSRAGGGRPATGPLRDLDEVQVIVEVCARAGRAQSVFAGNIYRLHVLPARAPENGLPAPVHTRQSASGDATTTGT